MRRLYVIAVALILGLITAALPGHGRPAQAGEVWCWDDPIIAVNGVVISINLGIRQSDLASVQSVDVNILVPAGADAQVLFIDTTYFTPQVHFTTVPTARGATPSTSFTAVVTVTARSSFDYQVVVMRETNRQTLTQVTNSQANIPVSLTFTP